MKFVILTTLLLVFCSDPTMDVWFQAGAGNGGEHGIATCDINLSRYTACDLVISKGQGCKARAEKTIASTSPTTVPELSVSAP